MPNVLKSTESHSVATNQLGAELQVVPLTSFDKREWLRIPDAIRIYGIGRSSLYELISDGKIKSASLRKRGNVRGIRLISATSLEAFLESIAKGGQTAQSNVTE